MSFMNWRMRKADIAEIIITQKIIMNWTVSWGYFHKFLDFYQLSLSLSLTVVLFSKSPHLTTHIKVNYELGCIGFLKTKQREVFRTIVATKTELFVTLVASGYLTKQTLFTSKFSGSYWSPSCISTVKTILWNNCYFFVVRFYDFF